MFWLTVSLLALNLFTERLGCARRPTSPAELETGPSADQPASNPQHKALRGSMVGLSSVKLSDLAPPHLCLSAQKVKYSGSFIIIHHQDHYIRIREDCDVK